MAKKNINDKTEDNHYLRCFPQPFLDELLKNNCVPFIGSGMSNNAVLPKGKKMPLWNELGEQIANILGPEYDKSNAIEAISEYENRFKRDALVSKLSELLFLEEAKPGKSHEVFCKMPFKKVCTTNFDNLLEQGYDDCKMRYFVKVREEQLPTFVDNKVEILKFHGDLENPSQLVATEEDYDNFVFSRLLLTTYLCNILLTSTPLFIGYSLDDTDFRQIFQLIKSRLGKLHKCAYIILFDCNEATRERYRRRGVYVINLPKGSKEYDEVLSSALSELFNYWKDNINVQSSNTEKQQGLILKDDVCLLLVRDGESEYYKDMLQDSFLNLGLTPVAVSDANSEYNSRTQTIVGLYAKAKYIISDSDVYTPAIGDKLDDSKKTIIITRDSKYEKNESAIIRPDNIFLNGSEQDEEIQSFWKELSSRMSKLFDVKKDSDIDKLIKGKLYQLAIIESCRKLEWELRKVFEYLDMKSVGLSQLLKYAIQKDIIGRNTIMELRKAVFFRNICVHENYQPIIEDAKYVKQVVNNALEEITKWKSKKEEQIMYV